ncbi:MAG: hypothetical protein CVU03_11465 [Bacteroidetes bacterium HGW-Bacteroidetes-2]|jgi:hypothetical protein|nr:MAG: hypothetical protein CVU03_11465 [Bacteroidetes bacterium HGW-Bacteroidetes-2]
MINPSRVIVFLYLLILGIFISCNSNKKEELSDKFEISTGEINIFKLEESDFEYDFKRNYLKKLSKNYK